MLVASDALSMGWVLVDGGGVLLVKLLGLLVLLVGLMTIVDGGGGGR